MLIKNIKLSMFFSLFIPPKTLLGAGVADAFAVARMLCARKKLLPRRLRKKIKKFFTFFSTKKKNNKGDSRCFFRFVKFEIRCFSG